MKIRMTLVVSILVAVLAFMSPMTASAYFVDFESYADFVPAESLTESGISFTSDVAGDWVTLMPATFANLTGQGLTDGACVGRGLTISFAQPQASVGFDFATISAVPMNVTAYYQGNIVDSGSFNGTIIIAFPEGYATVSAPQIDSVYIVAADCSVIDNLTTANAVVTGLNVPHVDNIQINASSPVTPYDSPGGSPVKLANGSTFMLPQDYDGNGFDTYIVTETAVVDGHTWYSIFLGNEDFVWIRPN